MKSFYTNVQVYGNKIFYRGIKDGIRVQKKIEYKPTLFTTKRTNTASSFKTFLGEDVVAINPGGIRDCKDFIRQYENVAGFKIYGNSKFEYTYIAEKFPDQIDWDSDHINVNTIDVEVSSENGFPDPESATEEVVSITFKDNSNFYSLGLNDYDTSKTPYVTYIKCKDETELLLKYIELWSRNYPDIITGWNVRFFDIPYLYNRIKKVLGQTYADKLSPWGRVYEKVVMTFGKPKKIYDIFGIAMLDYLELYRKFAPSGNSQVSYKLDNIAFVELKKRKLYHGVLHKLYKEDPQLFIEYNIQDVDLILQLEDKLKLLVLAMTLAYNSKTNFVDVFMQVRMWTMIIYNHLINQNMVAPLTRETESNTEYEGAYVKDPIIGAHKWLVSFDLKSEYPSLIIQYNISPDTIVEPENYTEVHRSILAQKPNVELLLDKKIDLSKLKELGCSFTPNQQFFKTDKQGFLPQIIDKMFKDRIAYQDKELEAEKKLEACTDDTLKPDLIKEKSRYGILQQAMKVCLNSGYGALGNTYFFLYDVRQAEGITSSGKLSIRWAIQNINKYLNTLLKTDGKDYVIASDTDSVYLSLDDLVNRTIKAKNPNATKKEIVAFLDSVCQTRLKPYIDNFYQDLADYVNAYSQRMIMSREAIADKGIWTAKKRYILRVWNNSGVDYAKPKIKIKGLEVIKSSTPPACKKKLGEILEIIMEDSDDGEVRVQKFISDFRKEFRQFKADEISFPRTVNGLTTYSDAANIFGSKTPIHVRGSLIYNHTVKKSNLTKDHELIKEGEKIKFLYLKEPNPVQSNIIAFPTNLPTEFDLEKYIDYDVQYDKSFVEPLKIILDAIGWQTEKKSSLWGAFK